MSCAQPSQSSSASPSSIDTIGYSSSHLAYSSIIPSASRVPAPLFLNVYLPSEYSSVAAQSSASAISLPGAYPARLDRLEDDLDRLLVVLEIRREAALVADAGRQLSLHEHLLQRVKHLRAHAQRVGERSRRRPARS